MKKLIDTDLIAILYRMSKGQLFAVLYQVLQGKTVEEAVADVSKPKPREKKTRQQNMFG